MKVLLRHRSHVHYGRCRSVPYDTAEKSAKFVRHFSFVECGRYSFVEGNWRCYEQIASGKAGEVFSHVRKVM